MSYERALAVQADTRIVRGSTIERKYMSTTIKRIALVAVAALGFGVLSVVPSQADVSGLVVTAVNGTATELNSDSRTAAVLSIQFLALAGNQDSVTVSIVAAAARPAASTNINGAGFFWTESTTSTGSTNYPLIDTATTVGAVVAGPVIVRDGIYNETAFRVKAPIGASSDSVNGTYSVKVKFSLGETTTSVVKAGTYSFNAIVGSTQAGVRVTQVVPFSITVAAPTVKPPLASFATAFIQAGTSPTFTGVVTDSVTAGTNLTGTVVGQIQVKNNSAVGVPVSDTITVSMTGPGSLFDQTTRGKSFTVIGVTDRTFDVISDGTSGTATITITTASGASFVKTATFFDTKPVKAVTTVVKAFIKAGTGSVADVFATTVTDTSGNVITNTGAVVTAAPTDTTTTVGGAATCAWNVAGAAYHCAVVGLSTLKFGPVAYTITATGTGVNTLVKVTTSATVTFADNVATTAVLAGPATGNPGATVEYTLTLTEKNGYPVADQTYGKDGLGGALFSTTAADTVASGWGTAPFSSSESYTSKSGVITSKVALPLAGVASLSLTLIGDGLQTLTTSGIDKTIGKTKLTVTTEVTNPGVDAATDAANDALDAANAATEAALSAAEAADAATTAAQEATDAVAALSESVTKLIAALQAQIKSLTTVVAKIAKKVKA
jgi:hypothetical protein